MKKNGIKIIAAIFMLFAVIQAHSQTQKKLTYAMISQMDVVPVNEKNYAGTETAFELRLPYTKSDSVQAAIPDLPSGVTFISLRRSEYSEEVYGTKIELWLNFSEPGTYKLRYLRITINGKMYNIPFSRITILENPRDILPQLVVSFENGKEIIQQKRARKDSKKAFESEIGVPLKFTVSLQYAVQLVSFDWPVPKNSLFSELERFEITKGTLRNSEFSEDKIPVASFEWTPLVKGEVFLPNMHFVATSYNGTRVELSMPEDYVFVYETDSETYESENSFNKYSYAFNSIAEDKKNKDRFEISNDECKKIAELRSLERKALPFGDAVKERKSYENQLNVRNEGNEPNVYVFYICLILSVVFAVFVVLFLLLHKVPQVLWMSVFFIVSITMTIHSVVCLNRKNGIFCGGGVKSVPETTCPSVNSIEKGKKVRIEQKSGGWMYVLVGNNGGWVLKQQIEEIK